MMSCRQVRKNLVDLVDGVLAADGRDRMEEHLRACVPCAAERDATSRVASMLAAAGAVASGPAVTGPGFEQRVLASVRARGNAPAPADGILVRFPQRWQLPVIRRPAPLQAAAAAAIMVLAGVVAVLYGGFTASRDAGPAIASYAPDREAGSWDDADVDAAYEMSDLDLVMPAREVPFSLRQDLVGVRSGRIPATTYVLEPAPDESAVMRASF